MTAFQPDPDKPTAQEELGGLRPEMTEERRHALGDLGLAIDNPRIAARSRASEYYGQEFGLSGHVTDRPEEVKEAIRAIKQGYRDKTLPGMENDPQREIEHVETSEEAAARLRRETDESWDALEEAQNSGRLF